MDITKIRVTQPFCLKGARQELDAIVPVSPVLAAELIARGRALPVIEQAEAAAPDAVKPRARKARGEAETQ